MIETSILKKSEEKAYTELLNYSDDASLFHSIPYKNLLIELLNIKSYILIARDGEKIVGAIPVFLKVSKKYGNVINSSPFIGSNGGFLVDSRLAYPLKRLVKKCLLERFMELANELNCTLSTVITSPYDRDILFYEDNLNYLWRASRIGYIKNLSDAIQNPQETLLKTVGKKCRTSIKRSKKNLTIEYSHEFADLFDMHKKNIESKGSVAKPIEFFNLVKKHFEPSTYELSYALMNGKRIGGLLVFFFKDIVEYFTPAFDIVYKEEQATSFLIYNAMINAIDNGLKYWNFGGTTLPDQEGVAHFKKSWGSQEYPYYYYTMNHKDVEKIRKLRKDDINEEYKWFYVIPFNELLEGEK